MICLLLYLQISGNVIHVSPTIKVLYLLKKRRVKVYAFRSSLRESLKQTISREEKKPSKLKS